MNDDDDMWARTTIRLVVILQAVIPQRSVDYCRAMERARKDEKSMTDADLDLVLEDPALRLLLGQDLTDSLRNLPPDIKYGDVRR